MFLAGNNGHHEVVLQVMSTEVEDEVAPPCILLLALPLTFKNHASYI